MREWFLREYAANMFFQVFHKILGFDEDSGRINIPDIRCLECSQNMKN